MGDGRRWDSKETNWVETTSKQGEQEEQTSALYTRQGRESSRGLYGLDVLTCMYRRSIEGMLEDLQVFPLGAEVTRQFRGSRRLGLWQFSCTESNLAQTRLDASQNAEHERAALSRPLT